MGYMSVLVFNIKIDLMHYFPHVADRLIFEDLFWFGSSLNDYKNFLFFKFNGLYGDQDRSLTDDGYGLIIRTIPFLGFRI